MSKLRLTTAALTMATLAYLPSANGQSPRTSPAPPSQQEQRSQNDQSDRNPADDARAMRQQGPTVTEALVQKLIKKNEAEIELATLAEQYSDSQEVKQFAKTMVQDHTSFIQTLQQQAGNKDASRARSQPDDTRPERTQRDQAEQDRNRNQLAPNERANANRRNNAQSNRVPMELCEVSEQACQNALEMTKEMLSKYKGQDFNMAYLGQQCVAHTMMLAELRAIESSGPEALRPIAKQASAKVQQHLDKAKQLAQKLEDDRRSQE